MDILTHTFSGVAVGTMMAPFVSPKWQQRFKTVAFCGLAGAVPDFDAISLWSKFDVTIGKWLGLPFSGKHIYSAKLWYSHHGFLHSLFAAVVFAFLLTIGFHFIRNRGSRLLLFTNYWNNYKVIVLAMVMAYCIHLLEDMPTPASTWGGVRFFWPSASYIGGAGKIWWWNNYDIFLIVWLVIVLNLVGLLIGQWRDFKIRKFTVGVFVAGLAMALVQINTRQNDYSYTGHTSRYSEYELKSKQEQKVILGPRLYRFMEQLDNAIPLYF